MKFLATQVAAVALLAASTAFSSPILGRTGTSCQATAQWPGWAGIKYAFIFGDSYTQTGFNYTLTPAPSRDNPLGNPPYPGYTSSNGPNWVGFLTTKYNASRLQTYDLAYGGATVNATLVAPYQPSVLSLIDQVRAEFLPGYAGANPTAADPPAWQGGDSLFAVWIGINDVGSTYYLGDSETAALQDQIVAQYASLVDDLHAVGARSFAFLTVPPVDRSPLARNNSAEAQAREKTAIEAFNVRVATMASSFAARNDTNVWVLDTQPLFTAVLDNPAAFPQTAHLQNTTDYCEAYASGTPGPDTFVASCGVPASAYFWINNLHPTSAIHDVVAEQLALALANGPNTCS